MTSRPFVLKVQWDSFAKAVNIHLRTSPPLMRYGEAASQGLASDEGDDQRQDLMRNGQRATQKGQPGVSPPEDYEGIQFSFLSIGLEEQLYPNLESACLTRVQTHLLFVNDGSIKRRKHA
ncbi:hypothetical protein [Nocardia brasiliensis]|uniref:hypothetical protein n=1 Tax=Nocardia brasiliensis TaxID=37326 RepID=UPI001892FE6C|nr:hypothetical protein [Nocardia brasiliensis]MBF6125559.1 hypothetical protein [Nocardia brasiliensis]